VNEVLSESDIRSITAALQTPSGRATIAQTMLEPFKKGRDYVGIGRQCFAVDHLPAGAPMWYDLDPQFVAAVVSAKGAVNYQEIATTRVNLEPIILAVYPKIHVLDVASRRFNILDREQERAQHEMAKIEDDKVFLAFQNPTLAASPQVNNLVNQSTPGNPGQLNPIVSNGSGLDPATAAQAFANVEQYDIPVANVIINAQQQKDLRLWTHRNFDPVTQRELIKTGYIGDLWGAQVRQSRRQTAGTINFLGDPQYLGVISVRIDLSHMDAPDPQQLYYGFVFFEAIGVAQLITVASSQANVTGTYTPTYPQS